MIKRIISAFKNPMSLGIVSVLAIIIALASTAGLSSTYAAWSEPSQAPTGGNADAPINVGTTMQTKGGIFRVQENYIQAFNNNGTGGLLNYNGNGGYFYNTTGVLSQNTAGYYTYLNYPGSGWGVYTNGSVYAASNMQAAGDMYANDYYITSISKWASTLGGSSITDTYGACVTVSAMYAAVCPNGYYLAAMDRFNCTHVPGSSGPDCVATCCQVR